MGTILGGLAVPAYAQPAPAPQAPATGLPGTGTVRSIAVSGNQRLEPETVISYMQLRVGDAYDRESVDQALRDLLETELFADVTIGGVDTGNIIIRVVENPVINRIVLEGNKRLKADKINPEIRLAPRQIFTRSKARADVARIIELYRRQGRFAAQVEPKIIQLDQNRVDVVFEISEGPKSKVRQINIIGNEAFPDSDLRGEMYTQQARLTSFFSGNTSYDPDRLAADQQKLRQFYLTQGYADFRVISAVAELTPDRRDFIITYVVEEGERYKFADVKVESEIRDFKSEDMQQLLPMKAGDWYNAKLIEDTVTSLNETAGLFGYAFADAQPDFSRDPEKKTMSVTFKIAEAPRVYVERIDINGNTNTRDKVVRREFRLVEGDPFNSVRVKRSRDRIQSLGFFQDNLEIEQTEGSAPDRVILTTNLEERSTGELQLSAGFSSLERFLINASIQQRNFMGKGQVVRASVNYSTYSKSVELGFTEPYLFDRNIALGFDVYRRDFNSFNFINNDRNTTYEQVTTGGQLRAGFPVTEYVSMAVRYGLNHDKVTLDEDLFFSDPDGAGPLPAVCDPLIAGRYLCESIGTNIVSSVGYSLEYNTLNNRLRPTRGQRALIHQDFAGLGGSIHYLRTRASAAKYWNIGRGFIFSANVEGGYVHSFDDSEGSGQDPVRLIDRFFLGEPQMRGFDIRGIGPRVLRRRYGADGALVPGKEGLISQDAIGGRAYYAGRAEIEIPLGAGIREMGLRPSVFVDIGSVFGIKDPNTTSILPSDPRTQNRCIGANGQSTPPSDAGTCPTGTTPAGGISPFQEKFVGDSPKPRLSVGFGINWNSPFGPFRIDIAKAILKEEGDDTKLFTFNVGTAF
ncbi:MAG: outer membrane protein assembly factor BamA [Sphingosinicella sp.]|nr:outer membrane protein assembly factor BamA [Sphingosinicella sp.]